MAEVILKNIKKIYPHQKHNVILFRLVKIFRKPERVAVDTAVQQHIRFLRLFDRLSDIFTGQVK